MVLMGVFWDGEKGASAFFTMRFEIGNNQNNW